MINHARTLLMNVDGSYMFYAELGEEVIPEAYRAKTLPQALMNVRRVLFGTTPDRAMLNYRCRQLLSLLQYTDLQSFITDLDERITYALTDSFLFNTQAFRPVYVQFGGTETELFIQGSHGAPDPTGRMKLQWDIEVTSSAVAEVTALRPRQDRTVEFSVTSGLSSPIPLHGSGLTVQLRNQVGLKYRVISYSRPTLDLGDLCATLGQVGSETLAELFLVGDPHGAIEPFLTFRNLWEQHGQLPYKLGGILLALIYHTDEL